MSLYAMGSKFVFALNTWLTDASKTCSSAEETQKWQYLSLLKNVLEGKSFALLRRNSNCGLRGF